MSTDVRHAAGQDWIEDVRTLLADQCESQRAQLIQLTADTGDPDTRAALISAARQGIAQTRAALSRIEDGDYGSLPEVRWDDPA